MRQKKNQSKETAHTIEQMAKNIESIAENSRQTNSHIAQSIRANKSKRTKIVTIVTFLASLATISGFTIKDLLWKNSDPPPAQQHEIYLCSEYSKLRVYAETDLTATLNFDTDSVRITAYLDTFQNGDSLEMVQKNETEWYKKVYFEEPGTYKVIASASAPNGETIENSIEIEVIP